MGRLAKRLLDVVGAVLILVVSSPLWLAIALWIWRDSPGPVFYRQHRIGQHGRSFLILKFRTMVVEADRQWTPPSSRDALGAFYFQDETDPRITKAGRWLRSTSLDELPNLWNVLRGEMSLVGPRPEVPEIVALYDENMRARLAMKPGMTGLAQISGRGSLSTAESLRYDLQYCRGWSFWSDCRILAKTVGVVTRRHGAM